jgi:predicted phage terminase large subunit-like protein
VRLVLDNPKQIYFLTHPEILEILYGGAAGGGKSTGLLAAALQYVDVPGYAALLLRRSYPDLTLPGALMDMAFEWLQPTTAQWSDKTKTWSFPTGGDPATLTFGYLESDRDRYRYQSAEFQFIGFDEVTQFTEIMYTYLFSRLRRREGVEVPLRMRAATNPGGIGHDWVRDRFLTRTEPGRLFIPAGLADNPHLDQQTYIQSLGNLDAVTRAQLLNGDWEIMPAGNLFRREWFRILEKAPARLAQVRYWDLAATEGRGDFTVGALVGYVDGQYWVLDIARTRARPRDVELLVRQAHERDGPEVAVCMEEEGGASGKALIDYYARKVLVGANFRGVRTTGSKLLRAQPVSAAAEAGNLYLRRAPWNSALLEEFVAFPDQHIHDDQVDAVSGAVGVLIEHARGEGPPLEDALSEMMDIPGVTPRRSGVRKFGRQDEDIGGEIPHL